MVLVRRRSKPTGLLTLAGLWLGCENAAERERNEAVPYFDHAAMAVSSLAAELVSAAPAIARPAVIQLAGQGLWLNDGASDPTLHVLDPKTGRLLHSLGRRGEGPGEFARGAFGLTVNPSDPDAVWAWDLRLQRLSRFESRPLREFEFRAIRLSGVPRVQRVVWVGADRIVGVGHSDSARFAIFDSAGERLEVVAGPLLGHAGIPYQERLKASNQGIYLCSRVDGRGFIIAYFDAGRLEYYDRHARLERIADVPFPSEPVFNRDSETNTLVLRRPRRWYVTCATTVKHLFAVFSGRLSKSFPDDVNGLGEFVHIFRWDGSLRATFRLDRAVLGITVDPAERTLYAVSPVDASVYRYRIPEDALLPENGAGGARGGQLSESR